MTVHARGYRPYRGGFVRTPAFVPIFSAGVRLISRTRGMRLLGLLFLFWTLIWGVSLYIQIGVGDGAARALRFGDVTDFVALSRQRLIGTLTAFYAGVTSLVSLLAIFTGAGLISDDLRARALSLYLVRPLRPTQYAVGKALVLPWILLTRTAVPGLCFWLLTGAWQLPGDTLRFYRENLDLLEVIGTYVLLSSGLFTGLILLLSAGSPRRSVVSGLAAAVLFGGLMLHGVGTQMRGTLGDLFRLAALPMDAVSPFLRLSLERRSTRDLRLAETLPNAQAVAVLAALLMVAGLVRVWWRARSVEVTE